MKILIASWGDFEKWKEVKYRFGDVEAIGPSTLPILQKAIKPDWTVIILSETLGKDFSSIESLHENINGRLEEFLERIGAGRELDILIVPGVGSFQHGSFKGSAMDIYYYTLYRLSEIIPHTQNLEVHFDITHGLNYITFLAYRALRDLLGITALRNPVHLRVYNSDPFVPGITKELTINVIEDTHVYPSPLNETLPGKSGYLYDHALPGKEFGKVLRGLKKLGNLIKTCGSLNAWIASVVHGLPLVFASFFPELGRIQDSIEEVFSTYQTYIEVKNKSVLRKLALGKGFGTLVKLAFQLRVVEDLPHGEEISYGELKRIAEALFRGRNLESTKIELEKISKVANSPMDWIRFRDLLELHGKNPSTQVSNRNFLAHAGLEANLIEVKRDGELYIRYTNEPVTYGGRKMNSSKVIGLILRDVIGD